MDNKFKTVDRARITRSRHNLSHERLLTADPFLLYPVMVEPCIPGDNWKIAHSLKIRMAPLAAPIYHNINAYIHTFFVPYRLLYKNWEDFISGKKTGKYKEPVPICAPKSHIPGQNNITPIQDINFYRDNSLADHLKFNTFSSGSDFTNKGGLRKKPNCFPLRAYNLIWNEYYRSPDIQKATWETYEDLNIDFDDESDTLDLLDGRDILDPSGRYLRARCWEKDYFTAMMPFQQRGDAPAFQLTGQTTSAIFNGSASALSPGTPNQSVVLQTSKGNMAIPLGSTVNLTDQPAAFFEWFNNNQVPLQNLGIFDISDLRLAVQLQRFLERMARGGYRYKEMLQSIWNVNNLDARLQRPEYIGGMRTPIVISEVLQTSESNINEDRPLGTFAGHGISADSNYIGSYFVREHGLIMSIMSIMPEAKYQQGIEKEWTKTSRYDYFMQMFQNLSEQAVMGHEIFNQGEGTGDPIIGYIPRYDEYRHRRSSVHGLFKTDLYFWHMGRVFANQPTLNEDLVRPSRQEILNLKRILAVPAQPMFLINIANICTPVRPIPWMGIPGLMDH